MHNQLAFCGSTLLVVLEIPNKVNWEEYVSQSSNQWES